MAVDMEARKKKLSKDFLYLFNKLNAWQLNMTEMTDYYEECFYSPLEPHLYGCNNMVELMKCKYINQILEVNLSAPIFSRVSCFLYIDWSRWCLCVVLCWEVECLGRPIC